MGEFEAILRYTSRLTNICRNEEKLNGVYGLVMRKSLHGSLSMGTTHVINADLYSSNKVMIRPTRLEVNTNSFAETRKTCIRRDLLECERRFFNNKTKFAFAESNREFDMILLNT